MNIFAASFGPKVIVDDAPFTTFTRKQVRFPRSRSKRIRLKWAKRQCNWTTTRTIIPGMYQVGPTPGLFGGMTQPYFVCDSRTFAAMQDELRRGGGR